MIDIDVYANDPLFCVFALRFFFHLHDRFDNKISAMIFQHISNCFSRCIVRQSYRSFQFFFVLMKLNLERDLSFLTTAAVNQNSLFDMILE